MTEMAKIWQEYKDGSTDSADQALLAENNGASLFYAAIIDLYHSRGEFSPRCRMLLEKAMEAETGNELYRATAEFANAQRFIWGGSKEATGASPPHTPRRRMSLALDNFSLEGTVRLAEKDRDVVARHASEALEELRVSIVSNAESQRKLVMLCLGVGQPDLLSDVVLAYAGGISAAPPRRRV